jgi:GNAT superfamily N-acetyltransferase
MDQADLLTIDQIAQNPALVTQHLTIVKGTNSEEILFRPLLCDDLLGLLQFFENLSETTRRFATYPSYDLQCAQQFCDEINQGDTFRMVAINTNGKIIALIEFNLCLEDFDLRRYERYDIKLNQASDIQLAPCIIDKYQNRHLGTQLLQLMIALAKRLGKKRMTLWSGVLIDNQQAIHFYQRNNFRMFQEKFIAADGYECYDGILQLT